MIKVVHIIHGLNTGGAETLVKDYALNFDQGEFDFVVLCMSHEKESPYEKILADNGMRVIFVEDYLLCKNWTGMVAKFVNHFQRYFVVRKLLRKESFDVLHTHLPINTFVKFSKPKKEMVIFHTVHNTPKELWSNNRKRQKDLCAVRWLIGHYDMRFIVLHEKMQKEINEMFGVTNSIVLNNGVDVEKFKSVKNKKQIRKELKITQGSFVMGHIGRFSEVKNQEFLVDIFREVSKKNSDAFLLMIGDGSDKDEIMKKLDNSGLKKKYLILSNRDDVPDLLNAMDVFVFPSLYEGLPLSLIEAQIAKKPCFISDRIDDYAIISNLVTRLPLENGAKKWADAIMNYKKPKKVIVDDENWDIKKITKQLEQLYLDALAENQNGKK